MDKCNYSNEFYILEEVLLQLMDFMVETSLKIFFLHLEGDTYVAMYAGM